MFFIIHVLETVVLNAMDVGELQLPSLLVCLGALSLIEGSSCQRIMEIMEFYDHGTVKF